MLTHLALTIPDTYAAPMIVAAAGGIAVIIGRTVQLTNRLATTVKDLERRMTNVESR